jgi:hypothetical protein
VVETGIDKSINKETTGGGVGMSNSTRHTSSIASDVQKARLMFRVEDGRPSFAFIVGSAFTGRQHSLHQDLGLTADLLSFENFCSGMRISGFRIDLDPQSTLSLKIFGEGQTQ